MRGSKLRRISVLALAIAAAVPGGAGAAPRGADPSSPAEAKQGIAGARMHAPAGATRYSTAGGERPRVFTPAQHLQSSGDPRSPLTYTTAMRSVLEQRWDLELPDVAELSESASAEEDLDVVRWGLPGGDLDGDGLADAVSLEYEPDADFFFVPTALRGLSGVDGAELWAMDLGGALDAFPLPAGDLTGDGADDVLVLRLDLDRDDSQIECSVVSCIFSGDASFHWTVEVIPGPGGTPAWTRRYDAEYRETYAGVGALVAGADADVLEVTNALVIPFLSDDHDGDGLADVVVDALDVNFIAVDAWVDGLVAYAEILPYRLLIATEAVVLSGDEGVERFARNSPLGSGTSLLYPAGDAVGNASGDLAWETQDVTEGLVVCVGLVFVGGCEQPSRSDIDIEMIDGSTLASAWTSRVSTSTTAFGFTEPSGGDPTGDGRADLFYTDYATEYGTAVISGADGAVTWRATGWSLPALIGPVGGAPGDDLLRVEFFDDQDLDVVLTRIDGATGALLSTSTRTIQIGDGFIDAIVYLIGDADPDGTLDPVLDWIRFDFIAHSLTSGVEVESGANGEGILSREVEGISFTMPGGNLDATAGDDLVAITFDSGEFLTDIRLDAIVLPEGLGLWNRTDTSAGGFDFTFAVTDDQAGDGGTELLYTRLAWENTGLVGRIDAVDGRTGSFRWGHGPPFTTPAERGGIAGVVTNAEGSPLSFMCVDATSPAGAFVDGTYSESDGTYTVAGLPAGEYRVHFYDCDFGTYAEEWYDDSPTPASADPVVVLTGDVVVGIDAALEQAGPLPDAPANDAFADAETIGSLPFTTELSTSGASNEPGEPQPGCAPIGATVWYAFAPPSDGLVHVTTAGSDFDTVLTVYTGSELGDLAEVACSDDAIDLQSLVSFPVTGGTTYYIQAGGFAGERGDLVLSMA